MGRPHVEKVGLSPLGEVDINKGEVGTNQEKGDLPVSYKTQL